MTPQQLLTTRVYENEPSNWSQIPQTGAETDHPTNYDALESSLVEEEPITVLSRSRMSSIPILPLQFCAMFSCLSGGVGPDDFPGVPSSLNHSVILLETWE